MAQVTIQNLSFAYEGSYSSVFEDLNLQFDTRWRLGLLARNGRGKTTLLRLLQGELVGSGTIGGLPPCSYFPPTVPDKSLAARVVAAQLAPQSEAWELERECSLLELSEEALERPFDSLSAGEQNKLCLAALFLREGDYLLIDEPTNHLDAKGRALLGKYLCGKQGFLLVSHDRAFLDESVDHILALLRTGVALQQGNCSSWLENRARQDAFEQAEQEKRQREVKELAAAAKQRAAWSEKLEKTKYGSKNSGLRPDRGYIGHKSAKMMQRAKSLDARREKSLQEAQGLLRDTERVEDLKLAQLPPPQERLLALEKLSLFYGTRQVCGPLNLTLEAGQRICLAGKNGAGKSSLLKLICGDALVCEGQVLRARGLRISYVSQETENLAGGLLDYARAYAIDESIFLSILRKLDFARVQFEKDLRDFSAGQKKKVLLARSLCEQAHLHIWDEPLNFIDLYSRIQIEQLLLQTQPSLLFVEHDRCFCQSVATDIWQL